MPKFNIIPINQWYSLKKQHPVSKNRLLETQRLWQVEALAEVHFENGWEVHNPISFLYFGVLWIDGRSHGGVFFQGQLGQPRAQPSVKQAELGSDVLQSQIQTELVRIVDVWAVCYVKIWQQIQCSSWTYRQHNIRTSVGLVSSRNSEDRSPGCWSCQVRPPSLLVAVELPA